MYVCMYVQFEWFGRTVAIGRPSNENFGLGMTHHLDRGGI